MSDENPRLQCEKCGRWYRLYKGGRQWLFPFYDENGEQLYDRLCVPCHKEFGIDLDASHAH